MKHPFSLFFRTAVILSVGILSILGTNVFSPGGAQANIGSLTENITAARIGIGTTYNMSRNLHVVGSPLFERAVDTAGFLIKRTAANRWFLGVNENPLIGYGFVISTFPEGAGSSTPRLLVTQEGKVGINTVNPYAGAKLTVVNDNITDYASAIIAITPSGNTGGVAGFHNAAHTWGALGAQGNGYGEGVYGRSDNTSCWGFLGGMALDKSGMGAYGENDNITSASWGSLGCASNTDASGIGAFGKNVSSNNYGGLGGSGSGAWGVTANRNSPGVYGESTSDNNTSGVVGRITNTSSTYSSGVYGESNSLNSPGVSGRNTAGGYAGYYTGSVYVIGNITATGQVNKSGGTFRIDHPLDPTNKYLQHSFVESPDMKNVYDGNIALDAKGEAVVTLPAYFETLNRDFRYQLTALGEPAPNLYIAQKISGNFFKIAGGKAGMEVSWQVTGIRQDPYAAAHPIVVEQVKPAGEKGTYLHPELYGQPAAQGMNQMGAMQPAVIQPAAMQAAGQFNMK